MTRFPIRPEAAPAFLELLRAIENAGATPCTTDPVPFTSDDRAERAEAATACRWCPALDPCAAYADAQAEPFHVWAGVDRTPRPKKKENAA